MGTWNAPCAFISRAISTSIWDPCSIESIPARTQFAMPVRPMACAAIGTFHVWASSTAASTSSGVNAVKSTGIPGVSTPPVATILIERAPARICSRTANLTPSAPSHCRANEFHPCPPVIVSAVPLATTLGPGIRPSAMALATSHTTDRNPPRSRTVVTPAARWRAALPTHLMAA